MSCLNVYGQDELPFTYSAEFGGLYSINKNNPYWIRSNQFGILPDSGSTALFIQNFHTKTDTNRFTNFKLGAELVTIVGHQVKLFFPELYGQMNLGKTRLLVGRKKRFRGFGDSTLSSGSVSWSGNATPLPEIEFSIPEYINFFNRTIGVKGYFSHGWFGKQKWVDNYYLHSKGLYLRVGKPQSKIKLYGDFLHHAQWAGKPKYYIPEENWLTVNEKFATGWQVYRDIVFPFNNPPLDTSGVASFDYENRYGNHLGQLDWAAEIIFPQSTLLLYRQLPFETGQTFSSLGNLDDGIYGISIANKNKDSGFRKLVFEFLHTTNQGMYRSGFLRLVGFHGLHYGRNQNFYFTHAQYRDGWAYNDKTIGTPFMVPGSEIRNEKIEDPHGAFNNNNNIKAGYLAMEYRLSSVIMQTRASLSKNYGSTLNVFEESASQLSFGYKMIIPLAEKNSFIHVNIGIDHGDLIKDNFGIMFSYKKIWN